MVTLKTRTDIVTKGTKLNAQVVPSSVPVIKNLQNMHEKSLPPTGARRRTRMELEYPSQPEDRGWARLQLELIQLDSELEGKGVVGTPKYPDLHGY
jgi:hypothetical protein